MLRVWPYFILVWGLYFYTSILIFSVYFRLQHLRSCLNLSYYQLLSSSVTNTKCQMQIKWSLFRKQKLMVWNRKLKFRGLIVHFCSISINICTYNISFILFIAFFVKMLIYFFVLSYFSFLIPPSLNFIIHGSMTIKLNN